MFIITTLTDKQLKKIVYIVRNFIFGEGLDGIDSPELKLLETAERLNLLERKFMEYVDDLLDRGCTNCDHTITQGLFTICKNPDSKKFNKVVVTDEFCNFHNYSGESDEQDQASTDLMLPWGYLTRPSNKKVSSRVRLLFLMTSTLLLIEVIKYPLSLFLRYSRVFKNLVATNLGEYSICQQTNQTI